MSCVDRELLHGLRNDIFDIRVADTISSSPPEIIRTNPDRKQKDILIIKHWRQESLTLYSREKEHCMDGYRGYT